MSTMPTRMPDYNPGGRRRFKPLRDRADATPRVGRILGIKPDELMHALGVVLCNGCAILFSPTSDGGAVSITVYYGDERARDYATSAEEFAEALGLVEGIAEAHAYISPNGALKAPQGPSQATKK